MGKLKIVYNDLTPYEDVIPAIGTRDYKDENYECDFSLVRQIKDIQKKQNDGIATKKDEQNLKALELTIWNKYERLFHKRYNVYRKMMTQRGKSPEAFETWQAEFWPIFEHTFESTDLVEGVIKKKQDPYKWGYWIRLDNYLSSYSRDMVKEASEGLQQGYFVGGIYNLSGKDGNNSDTTNVDKYSRYGSVISAEDDFEQKEIRNAFNISMEKWQQSLSVNQSKMCAMAAAGHSIQEIAKEFKVKKSVIEDTMTYLKNRFQKVLTETSGLSYKELIDSLSNMRSGTMVFAPMAMSHTETVEELKKEAETQGDEGMDLSGLLNS